MLTVKEDDKKLERRAAYQSWGTKNREPRKTRGERGYEACFLSCSSQRQEWACWKYTRGIDVSSETQRHEHLLELRPGCPGLLDRLRITKTSNNTGYGGGKG